MRSSFVRRLAMLAVAVTAGAAHADVFNGTPFNIIDQTFTSGTTTVTGLGTLTGLTLSITLSHTFASDLQIILSGPSGGQVVFDSAQGSNNFAGTYIFDDSAAVDIEFAPAPGGVITPGTYTGIIPLSNFYGIDPNGVWTLIIFDGFDADQGAVTAWSINAVPTPGAAAVLGLGGLMASGGAAAALDRLIRLH